MITRRARTASGDGWEIIEVDARGFDLRLIGRVWRVPGGWKGQRWDGMVCPDTRPKLAMAIEDLKARAKKLTRPRALEYPEKGKARKGPKGRKVTRARIERARAAIARDLR